MNRRVHDWLQSSSAVGGSSPAQEAGEENQTVSRPFPDRFSFRAWCSFRFIDQQHVAGGRRFNGVETACLALTTLACFSKNENH